MEVLFFDGTILTMEKETDNPEAVFVKDGGIAFVGNLEEAKSLMSPSCAQIDLKGRCLMPAFIDSHSHLTQFASILKFVSLKDTKCFDDIIAKLKKYKETKKLDENSWIIGFGYDHNNLKENTHPNRHVLDTVSLTNPILISHASGHMGVANSKTLELANITPSTQNPQGGVYGRESDGKTPNGYLEEMTFIKASTLAPRPTKEEYMELLVQAQNIYASYGITTVQEGLLKETEAEILSTANQKGKLFLDIVGYADMNSLELMEKWENYVGKYKGHFKIGGYKIFLDGSPQGKTAWLTSPYEGEKDGYLGYPIYTDEQIRNFVKKSEEEGKQLLAHCNGDAAAEQFIKAHDKPSQNRNVMIHAQALRTDQLIPLNKAGIMPSYFVAHTYYWGDIHIKNLGTRRASKISPTGSTAKLGIPFTLHQDTPVLPPDMIDTIWCAANRVTLSGKQLDQSETISTFDALKAITYNSAYQYFEEDKKGTIRKGKLADLIILSENPLKKPKHRLKEIYVTNTFKNGEQIYFG